MRRRWGLRWRSCQWTDRRGRRQATNRCRGCRGIWNGRCGRRRLIRHRCRNCRRCNRMRRRKWWQRRRWHWPPIRTLEVNDISILRNSIAAKGSCPTRLMSAYMRVDHLIYREPSIPGAAINDSRATKNPVIGVLRPLTTIIPLDFVVDAGACIHYEVRYALGGPHCFCA